MEGYQFIKGYRHNEELRNSFNELASGTFGINFEKWYESGFWTDKYEPYSLLAGEKVVANVSVNKIGLLVNGKRKQAIQIGTVMTHPEHRKRGLSAFLMDKVLQDFQDSDLFYLFANSTVLDFYPKFGFHAVQEHQGILEVTGQAEKIELAKLDTGRPEDLKMISQLAENRMAVSKKFSTADTAELFMFYCLYAFPEDIYYCREEDAVILMKKEGRDLHVFDIASLKPFDVEKFVTQIAPEGTEQVYVHFTVDTRSENWTSHVFQGDEVLFVKAAKGLELPAAFKHPITSQA
jgi:predicted N-acetyltransferase YhbS